MSTLHNTPSHHAPGGGGGGGGKGRGEGKGRRGRGGGGGGGEEEGEGGRGGGGKGRGEGGSSIMCNPDTDSTSVHKCYSYYLLPINQSINQSIISMYSSSNLWHVGNSHALHFMVDQLREGDTQVTDCGSGEEMETQRESGHMNN